MPNFSNKDTIKMHQICSKLMITPSLKSFWWQIYYFWADIICYCYWCFYCWVWTYFCLTHLMPIIASYRDQPIDLQCQLIAWFLFNETNDLKWINWGFRIIIIPGIYPQHLYLIGSWHNFSFLYFKFNYWIKNLLFRKLMLTITKFPFLVTVYLFVSRNRQPIKNNLITKKVLKCF